MAISLNASGLSDTAHYTPPTGWQTPTGLIDFKVQSNSFRPSGFTGLAGIIASSPASSGVLSSQMTALQDATAFGDDSGLAFLTPAGDGYYCALQNTNMRIYSVVAGVQTGGALASIGSLVYLAGAAFSAKYNIVAGAGNSSIDVFQNSVSTTVPIVSLTGLTYAAGISPGIVANWGNSNAAGFTAATVDGLASGAPSISSINQLISGAASTIVFSSAFVPTGLTISDGTTSVTVTSFSGSGTTYTFTCPNLTDGVVGAKLGAVSVTSTNGTLITASFADTYEKTDYDSVLITSLGSGNIADGFSPAMAVGDQFAFDPDKGQIDAAGVFFSNFTGEQTVWQHSVTDNKWRSFLIITIDGSIVEISRLLTASPIVGRKITGTKITGLKI